MREAPAAVPVLLVGSGNPHKLDEIRAVLADLGVEVLGADVLPDAPPIEETGATFEENASLKALAFARAAVALRRSGGPASADDRPLWVISDDSGLCVDALDGRPGVHSARYAASAPGRNADSAANNRRLLRELDGVPDERRTARFVCVIAAAEVPTDAASPPRHLFTVRGECAGRIATAERGSGGFGYDPLFVAPELGRTFAEIPPAEKNRMSHRGRALVALRRRIEDLVRGAGSPAGGRA